MVTVLNYVIHLFDICSIVRKQYLDLWQVGKIIKVALTAALDTTATRTSNQGQCYVRIKNKSGLTCDAFSLFISRKNMLL